MNTTISGAVLGKAARAVKGIAGRGSYMPVLDMVRIRSIREGLEISGTNLETWIDYTISCDTEPGSQVFIDAARLLGAVKGRKGSQNIGINGSLFQVGALMIEDSPDMAIDYPIQPEYTDEVQHVYSFMGDQFKSMVKHHKCTSMKYGQTSRLNLTCVNVDYTGKGARFVTTDGYSLTCERFGGQIAGDNVRQALVPMEYMIKAAAAAGARDLVQLDVLHAIDDAVRSIMRIRIVNDAGVVIEYYVRCVDEQFPDYDRVIPAHKNAKVQFDVQPAELGRIVSEAMQCAPEDSGAVKLEVVVRDPQGCLVDRLHVSSESAAGSYHNSIEIVVPNHWTVDAAPVWFNGAYLAKIAGFSSDDSIEFMRVSLSEPLQPARFDYDYDQVAVLMPVNITRS